MKGHSAPSQLNNPATPQKACAGCGGTIVWRRNRAANWDSIMYCSASCRRVSVARTIAGFNAESEGRDRRGTEGGSYALARFNFRVTGTLI